MSYELEKQRKEWKKKRERELVEAFLTEKGKFHLQEEMLYEIRMLKWNPKEYYDENYLLEESYRIITERIKSVEKAIDSFKTEKKTYKENREKQKEASKEARQQLHDKYKDLPTQSVKQMRRCIYCKFCTKPASMTEVHKELDKQVGLSINKRRKVYHISKTARKEDLVHFCQINMGEFNAQKSREIISAIMFPIEKPETSVCSMFEFPPELERYMKSIHKP